MTWREFQTDAAALASLVMFCTAVIILIQAIETIGGYFP